MRKTAASAAILLLQIIFPAAASAEIHLKFSDSKQIVADSKEPKHFDIAWDGVNFGVVYDDYSYSGAFFLLVDPSGGVVRSAKKISSDKQAVYPKIIWTGKEYAILYAGGVPMGSSHRLNYYLARYNAAGDELSHKKLIGTSSYDSYAMQSQLLWTGKEYGIFYMADPDEPAGWANTRPLYCKADKSGKPGPILKEYYCEFTYTDSLWDGSRYIVVGMTTMRGWRPHGVAQLLTISEGGEILTETTVSGFGAMSSISGISIAPSKKKNTFLIALGGSIMISGAAPPAYWVSDLYTTTAKIKSKTVKGFSPKRASKTTIGDWQSPDLVSCGGRCYAVCYHAYSGCFIRVAEIKANGALVDTTLHVDSW